jgi:hypothetical protein
MGRTQSLALWFSRYFKARRYQPVLNDTAFSELQNRLHQFNSGRGLQQNQILIPESLRQRFRQLATSVRRRPLQINPTCCGHALPQVFGFVPISVRVGHPIRERQWRADRSSALRCARSSRLGVAFVGEWTGLIWLRANRAGKFGSNAWR